MSLSRTDEHGLRMVIARIAAGDAAYVDAVVTRVADILATRPEHTDTPRDVLRSLAFGWLARPAELLTLLLEHTEPDDRARGRRRPRASPASEPPARALAFPADLLDALRAIDPERLRPAAVLYVHLHEAACPACDRGHRGGRCGGAGRGPRPPDPGPAHRVCSATPA